MKPNLRMKKNGEKDGNWSNLIGINLSQAKKKNNFQKFSRNFLEIFEVEYQKVDYQKVKNG